MQELLRSAAEFAPRRGELFSPLIITDEVRAELLRNFFPAGLESGMDLTNESELPQMVVREMRSLFPRRIAENPFFSLADLIESVYDVVASHCRYTQPIQEHGNARFRQILLRASGVAAPSLPQELRDRAESDKRLLEDREDAVQRLLAVQVEKAGKAPLKAVSDALVTDATRVQHVVSVHAASDGRREPLPLLQWDDQTLQLFDFIFQDLRRPEGTELGIHVALRNHFGNDDFTRADVRAELEFAASAACVDYFGTAIHAYLRRKLDALFRATVLSFPFVGPNPIIPTGPGHLFPGGIVPQSTTWPISFTEPRVAGQVQQQRCLEFIERDFGASFCPFLADGNNMPEIAGGKRQRMNDEVNRCFFVHLGAALGLHPVWLQVMNLWHSFSIFAPISAPGTIPDPRR
jgi:hypothetical protein